MAASLLTVTLRHFRSRLFHPLVSGRHMHKFHLLAAATAILLAGPSQANDAHAPAAADTASQVRGVVSTILQSNARFSKATPSRHFQKFAERQTPRATVVTCADSRVHENDFHLSPDNDLFMVRNIGNQMATAEGSVEYGVRHLHTPLLLIIGHAACGAIKAASGDYSGIEPPIRKELDTIQIPKGIDVTDGVLLNVNRQVDAAMQKFTPEIGAGKLAVIGAFYDFRNDLKAGYGKLLVTNVNGETDPASIQAMLRQGKLLKGVAPY